MNDIIFVFLIFCIGFVVGVTVYYRYVVQDLLDGKISYFNGQAYKCLPWEEKE